MHPTTIDLLRHGEVQGGACFRGSQDDPLSDTGWRQMQQQTRHIDWDMIISSPLQRCQNFAQELSRQQQIPLHIEAGLQEIDFGIWEGKTAAEIELAFPGQLQHYYDDPTHCPPACGESFSAFKKRVLQSWESLLKTCSQQHILIITHAGVIRLLFSHILGLEYQQSFQIDIPTACLSRFSCFHTDKVPYIQLNFHQPCGSLISRQK